MARREDTPFNLAFLDVMFCGFGAVVLLVMLLYGKIVAERLETHKDLRAQVLATQREVTVSEERVKMRQTALKSTETRLQAARQELYAAQKRIAELEAQRQGGPDPAAGDQRIADMEAELQRLQQRVEALREEATEGSGEQVAAFAGDGRRQYLSGLKLGGARVLILLDASASMLDETIVNVIRLRNMPEAQRRSAAKWRQAVRTARWLLANLDPESEFQLYLFDTQGRAILADTAGQWIAANDSARMEAVIAKLENEVAPKDGTSLTNAFSVVKSLSPRPDNILLITDGLPTQGAAPPRSNTVSGEDRLRHFDRAMRDLGAAIPVNTILLPMEGDAVAAGLLAVGDAHPRIVLDAIAGLAMKKRMPRRNLEIFNLSFLDVVSVGFGAVVLLLVIVKVTDPVMTERMGADLSQTLKLLEEQAASLSQQIPQIQTEIDTKQGALENMLANLAVLNRDRRQLEAQLAAEQEQTEAQRAAAAELEAARQSLTEEMERLLRQQDRQISDQSIIGGIPVDSEYVIFIIDTSGSMQEGAWPLVMQKVRQVLDIYPQVKGIQILSDMGQYMFSQYAGQWIPDSGARRAAVISRMSSWAPFSNSSPVEGIEHAIARYADPDKKISIFIFGDDFSAGAVQPVLNQVERIIARKAGAAGQVRIHAMGFPVLFDIRGGLNPNSIRFAALMRALAQENRGSFVGLNSRHVGQ